MSFTPSLAGFPEADLPTMSTPWILYRLYKLNTSSADFLRYLHSLIRHDEVDQYLTSLRGSELARLVDFLGEVRALLSVLRPVTKRALQTLSATSANDNVSRQCLHKLQAICAHRAILPSSYIISNDLVRVGGHPIAVGGISDVWKGTYRGMRVSIKCLRVPRNDDQALKKVGIQCGTSLSRLLKNTCGFAVIFQRGRYAEKAEAPEHRPFHRRYNKSFANRFGVDAKRNSVGVRREKPRCEADQPCESPPVIALDR